jgi:hypothetical protein
MAVAIPRRVPAMEGAYSAAAAVTTDT